jgi:hypothetical protein
MLRVALKRLLVVSNVEVGAVLKVEEEEDEPSRVQGMVRRLH